jgi:SAM-dependent methyltransferase
VTRSAFLYEDPRFRVVGEPRVSVPAAALEALALAHGDLTEHPDACLVSCLCGQSGDVRVTLSDRHGLPLQLVLCRQCGLIRANPQPSAERLAWFYSRVYRRLYGPFASDDRALFESKLWKGRLVQRALLSSGARLPEGPVVDLGCGGGWTLSAFAGGDGTGGDGLNGGDGTGGDGAGPGRACIGFDFDERLLELGQKRGLDLRLGGVQKARADGVRAALLIFGHVLEHTLDPVAELRGLAPLLTEAGLLYLEVPHTRRIGSTELRDDSSRYWQRAHLWDFQRAHLVALAERAGYGIVWSSEDDKSVFLLCRAGGAGAVSEFPRLGHQVESQLLGFEALYQSAPHRARRAARQALRSGSGLLRRLKIPRTG